MTATEGRFWDPELGLEPIAAGNGQPATPTSVLNFQTLAALCAEVDAAGPRRWLARGIWPSGTYGVHAAEMKAQKTWNALDLAVSVASNTAWLDTIPIDDPGSVLVFAGEGGKAAIVRRIRAICTSRQVTAETLPIVVSARAPHLSDDHHLHLFTEQVEHQQPRLVLLDPLYLAARGAKGSDLYAMGEMLERAQHICDPRGAALMAVTHYNRREGTGPMRFSGAGPAEWGRVLIGARVISRHTHPITLETTVTLELDIIGGEVPDQTVRLRRVIRADDPASLDSPLRYQVEIVAADADDGNPELPPAARKLLEALHEETDPAPASDLVDTIERKHGHGLKRETVSRNLNALEKAGLVICTNPDAGLMTPKLWLLNTRVTSVMSHVMSHDGDARVTCVTTPIGGHAVTSHDTVAREREDHTTRDWLDELATTDARLTTERDLEDDALEELA